MAANVDTVSTRATRPPTAPLRTRGFRRWAPTLAPDVLLVLLFAALGRASHDEGSLLVGAVVTAAPFLGGMAAGWVLVLLTRRRVPLSVADGIPVWLGSVVLGMLLRLLTGQGTAWSFIAVATLVLGAFLLGWRLLGTLVRRLRRPS